MRRTLLLLSLILAPSAISISAQTPPPGAPPAPVVYANLNQLMRGVLYPEANIVFSPQFDDPAKVKQALDPGMATDPLTSTFGGWQAVENASLALAESANLLLVPGRVCSNGVPAPIGEPEWGKFVQEVRDAAMQAYKAAQAKDQDKISELSDAVSKSCEHCHNKWRNRKTAANRCK